MSNKLELIHTSPAPTSAIESIRMPLRTSLTAHATARPMPSHSDDVDWQRALVLLRHNWLLGALFMFAVIFATMVVSFAMKPVYEPEAKIELDPPGREIFSLQNGGDASADAEYLETQSQKLQSDELAIRVIRALRLDQNREFAGKLAVHAATTATNADPKNAPTLT